jgi:uncharacterized protein (PEP-CTERM system associated)
MAAAGPASAQRWATTAALDGGVTFTDNGNFGSSEEQKSDVIVTLTPRLGFLRDGGRLRVSGDVALPVTTYVRGTQASGIDPSFFLNASLEAVENFFFVDASMQLTREVDNPFGAQTPIGSDVNDQDVFRASISPYITGNIGSRIRYQLRNDSSYTRSKGGEFELENDYAIRNFAEIALLPRPLGLRATFTREDASANDPGAVSYRYSSEIARAGVDYAPTAQLLLTAYGARETNNYPGIDSDRGFYGASVSWKPSERTNLFGAWEDRYFGGSWRFSFDHRMPRLAWAFTSSRDDSTTPQRFLGVPATQNVAALIDASLTTRIPDPIERARAVEDLIVSRGLPRTLAGPIDIYTERLEIQTSTVGTVTLIGVRNTLAFNLFMTKTQGVYSALFPSVVPGSDQDNEQRGVGLSFGHTLNAVTTVSADASWRETRGLRSFADEQTTQQTYQLRVTRSLAPRTSATAGARYQTLKSNVEPEGTEVAVFVGLGHRF